MRIRAPTEFATLLDSRDSHLILPFCPVFFFEGDAEKSVKARYYGGIQPIQIIFYVTVVVTVAP